MPFPKDCRITYRDLGLDGKMLIPEKQEVVVPNFLFHGRFPQHSAKAKWVGLVPNCASVLWLPSYWFYNSYKFFWLHCLALFYSKSFYPCLWGSYLPSFSSSLWPLFKHSWIAVIVSALVPPTLVLKPEIHLPNSHQKNLPETCLSCHITSMLKTCEGLSVGLGSDCQCSQTQCPHLQWIFYNASFTFSKRNP